MIESGQIVVLNGAPRSGKSSIVRAVQERFDGPWMNLGVDVFVRGVTPERYRPGIGLRPGGERPDLEPLLPIFYAALYESVAAHSRLGLDVVVDVGHHDAYSQPLGILPDVAARLDGLARAVRRRSLPGRRDHGPTRRRHRTATRRRQPTVRYPPR